MTAIPSLPKFPSKGQIAQQLNNLDTKPLKPISALSIPELCQEFVNLHTTGHQELARPYFNELVRRDHFQQALQALALGGAK